MAEKTQAERKLEEVMKKRFPTPKAAEDYITANSPPGSRLTVKEIQKINKTGKILGRPYYVIGKPGLGE